MVSGLRNVSASGIYTDLMRKFRDEGHEVYIIYPNERRTGLPTAVELCKDGQHGIPVPDYVDENVSTKVVKIIQSYVGIVNKMVWRKF